MVHALKDTAIRNLPGELHQRRRIILGELKSRTLWFIRLRWWVPPSILVGTNLARWIGVEFESRALLLVAAFILAYNFVFYWQSRRVKVEPGEQAKPLQRFTYWQVGLDYAAMFLLVHYTGGAASPFVFFFIFHITFSAIFLPRRSAFGFAGLATAGMVFIAAAEYLGWISHHPLIFQGRAIDLEGQPFHILVGLGFFAGFVFISVLSISAVMRMLQKRILDLAELSEAVTTLNDKLNALYAMVQAIGSKQRLGKVLHTVTSELSRVMDVQATSVKLLSEDGKYLRYAAAHGLPDEFLKNKVIEVAKSPLNRRIIEGEPFVTGHVTQREMFQFGEDLEAARLRSVLFVPLIVENRVIGTLGAYGTLPERFGSADLDFLRLAAGVVAIAIENARAYEAIERLIQERSWFMMRVAHNLRAPLAAVLSVVEVVQGGYLGGLNDAQHEHLRRVERRVRTMLSMINELLTLTKTRSETRQVAYRPVDLKVVADRIQRMFQDEATQKGLTFEVVVPEDLPEVWGDQEMIEQMLENLVSNSIKYTPSGGRVGITFLFESDGIVRILVCDSGIGISKDEISSLFKEFFRGQNARAVEEIGTGLGLTIVKDILDQHGGQIQVESEEGLGTTFTVHLPTAPRDCAAMR